MNISNALEREKKQRLIAEDAKDAEKAQKIRAQHEKQNADIARKAAELQKLKALASEAATREALKESQDNLCLAYAKAFRCKLASNP